MSECVAIVVGAGGALGRATAERLVVTGFMVVVVVLESIRLDLGSGSQVHP